MDRKGKKRPEQNARSRKMINSNRQYTCQASRITFHRLYSLFRNHAGFIGTSRPNCCTTHGSYQPLNEQGLSLVSTLWVITILSLLATEFLHSIHLEQRAQANFVDRTKFHYAAKAAFQHAIAILRSDDTPFDALGEDWATTITGQIADGIRTGHFLPYQADITDQSSKVNVNTADGNMLSNLLALIGYEDVEMSDGALVQAIKAARPFRTVRDLAKVEGMTQILLYGSQAQNTEEFGDNRMEFPSALGLIKFATVYSIDTNTDLNGQKRVNIKAATTQQLVQIRDKNNQPVFSQGEAESLIQQQDSIETIGDLLILRAISDDTFNQIRNQISTANDKENEAIVNINTADANRLQTLDGIDQGIAQRTIDHRNTEGNFPNTDRLKDVKIVTIDEFKSIVDKISITGDAILNGLINLNTAPPEILQLLPRMDASKAQEIIDYRESSGFEETQTVQGKSQNNVHGNPFTDVGQLLDLAGIDVGTFREIVPLVTYRSHGYLIEATGTDTRGKTISSCVGAVDRTGQQVVVTYWKQN